MWVYLRSSRPKRAQQAQVHAVLRGKANIVAIMSDFAAFDGRRGIGAVLLKDVSVSIEMTQVG
jgi:hypothetical protein